MSTGTYIRLIDGPCAGLQGRVDGPDDLWPNTHVYVTWRDGTRACMPICRLEPLAAQH